ncbi:MAG: hypothetical protein E7507_03185 [Ruminococcus sp.]|nr:hypothetical protein [Ruminococcus sp.]
MNNLLKTLLLFLTGGVIYSVIEILFRGYTHWTMAVAGGLCLTLIYLMDSVTKNSSLALKCLFGSLIITAVELSVGLIVNTALGWNIWDYSHLPLNLMGQICFPFSVIWMLITVPALYICRFYRGVIFPRLALV